MDHLGRAKGMVEQGEGAAFFEDVSSYQAVKMHSLISIAESLERITVVLESEKGPRRTPEASPLCAAVARVEKFLQGLGT